MDIRLGDVLTMKKAHPCGSREWEVLRVGMDFRLKCTGCGHMIMIPRSKAEKNIRHVRHADGTEAKVEQKRRRRKEAQILSTKVIYDMIKNGKFVSDYTSKDDIKICAEDQIPLIKGVSLKVQYAGKTYIADGYYCEKCGTTFVKITPEMIEHQKQRAEEDKQEQQTRKELEEEKKIEAGKKKTLYICKGTIACQRRGHAIESATAVIGTLRENDIKINCNYCKQCRKYFINYNEYVHYRNKYGIIMGNFKITHSDSFSDAFSGRAEQSLLNLCGYTVNQTDDLTPRERQAILSYLMRNRIISKHEIMSHLQMLINTNGKRPQMRVANARWNEDLDYVRNYRIGQQEHVPIKNIKKWHG